MKKIPELIVTSHDSRGPAIQHGLNAAGGRLLGQVAWDSPAGFLCYFATQLCFTLHNI